ncbi:hypothetical protein RUND412_001059 [Rhizina undulata]
MEEENHYPEKNNDKTPVSTYDHKSAKALLTNLPRPEKNGSHEDLVASYQRLLEFVEKIAHAAEIPEKAFVDTRRRADLTAYAGPSGHNQRKEARLDTTGAEFLRLYVADPNGGIS